ncbi:SusC/RagA family TonB-linked outer membrane protein [Sphingobacterium sp.]|uniref:SusC/RagA family TonB-linked outer membrane protein n=1 Tax=Sphingobacterium sp. TaxID=341027 RepID=UPI00289E91F4|nr:SusC/RagA family TonB-linked outer membrane protein [Sphingobacterium sp.]
MNNPVDTKRWGGSLYPDFCKNYSILPKSLLKMRLAAYLVLGTSLQLSANTYAQKVNLKFEKSSLETVFKEIRKQSGYSFLYNNELLKKGQKISVHLSNANVEQALDILLKDQPLEYHINGKIISLIPKAGPIRSKDNPSATITIQKKLNGYVRNEKGEPLQNATVSLKGTLVSTSTNSSGYFELTNAPAKGSLLISYVGYQTQEVSIAADLNNIRLVSETKALAEVVVSTGFQTINAERATGSFGRVSQEQIEKPSTNIAQRIIGTTAGVQATLDVDGNPRFEIRGQTSLNIRDAAGNLTANASPLVVVDGFAIQGDFKSINPNDVESINILKDAAAASIWGARAANGVIVIVTKKARQGTPLRVDFQAFTRIGQKFDLSYVNPLASSKETIDYEKMAFNKWSAVENSGSLESNYDKVWSQGLVALSENHLGFLSDTERDAQLARLSTLDNRQQIKDLLLAAPNSQQYNLSMQGSSGRMNNLFSLMHERNQSNFQETKNQKYMLNYRTSVNLFSWLDFNASTMLQYNNYDKNGVTLADIQGLSPYDMLTDADGSFTNISQYYWPLLQRSVPMNKFPYADWTYNPAQEIHARNKTSKELNARFMGGLTFKLMKGLSFDTKLQYELFNTNNRYLYNEDSFYVRKKVNQATSWDTKTGTLVSNLPKGGIIEQPLSSPSEWNQVRVHAYSFRNQVNFNRIFNGKHEINAIAGSEISNQVSEQFYHPTVFGYNDATLTVGSFPNGPGGTFAPIKDWMGKNQTFTYSNAFGYRTERFFSLYGNAAYTYLNKYTLSGSIRTDASNMITDDPAYRYAPFWSLGGSYQIKREPFMQAANWLDKLNLRLTYGFNGNVDRSTSFRPLVALGTLPNIYTNDNTARISSYGNPSLRWERTGTWNAGIDYSLWQGKLYGKVDVYNKQGKDLIAELSIPAINGVTKQKLNNAEINNKGIELEFGTTLPLKGSDITWRGNLNFSYNKNKVTKLFVANYVAYDLYGYGQNYGAYVQGYDANSMWMFDYAGVHNNQPMVNGANGDRYDFGAWSPGDGRDYLVNVGTRVAPYTLGFSNTFDIYDFSLSFILTGKLGHVFKTLPFDYPAVGYDRLLPNKKLSDVINGDPNQIVPLPLNDIEPRYYFWDRYTQYLSYLSANASHLRMQEVNASYRLPTKKWSILKKSDAMVYLQGNDLFTVLFNKQGEDPEFPLGTMKPRPRFTFGFKVGF